MINIIGNSNLYVKGTSRFTFFKGDGTVKWETNKLQTANINTSLNLGSINGGIGNPVLINIPDTPDMSVDITAANYAIEAQASMVGGGIHGNGKVPFEEMVTFGENGTATVSGIPVIPLGGSELRGTLLSLNGKKNIVHEGISFVETEGKYSFTYPGAKSGDKGCVRYYIQKPEYLQYEITGNPTPEIGIGVVVIPLYYAAVQNDPAKGMHVGNIHITVPKMQWTAETAQEVSQTANTNTVAKAKALGAEDTESEDCTSNKLIIAYVTVELFDSDWTEDAAKIVVLNAPISVAAGEKAAITAKYISRSGNTLNNLSPASEYLEFKVTDGDTYATVDKNGVITGNATGSAVILVKPKSTFANAGGLSTTVDVEVKA